MNSVGVALLIAGAFILLVGAALLLWLWFGTGPRLGRAFRRGQRQLQKGDWRAAMEILQPHYRDERLSTRWNNRVRHALSVCCEKAGRDYLQQSQFEKALESFEESAELAHQAASEHRSLVMERMLDEVHSIFAGADASSVSQAQELITRTLALEPHCVEAMFWQSLCFLREKNTDQAIASLRNITSAESGKQAERSNRKSIDPYLYLGALLLEKGESAEALRFLSEANRIDGNCPIVICHLARAMLANHGDAGFAVRALQRGLGPRGFQLWANAPHSIWVEGFPEGKSYVRKLAVKHRFTCPLWGKDFLSVQRQANTALGQGYFRLGQFDRAIEVFERLSHETAPSLDVLRGLGLSLVRMDRYDEAFKHLRTAHELENQKTHLTSGYLAVCGARGKPASPEDKINNVKWAMWLVRDFDVPGDSEWVELLGQIFAEARTCGVDVEPADQLRLCAHFASIDATDPQAADAYHDLLVANPQSVKSEYAWLYCRAAQINDLQHEFGANLFARLFEDVEPAKEFFASRQWDFDDLEYYFLERSARSEPGRFPEVLGPDYPAIGRKFLTDRIGQLETDGKTEQALATAGVLVKLAPDNPQGYECLARLHYQTGNASEAMTVLKEWSRRHPSASMPLVRLGVLCHQAGEYDEASGYLRTAIGLTSGRSRAAVAFLSARLKLVEAMAASGDDAQEKSKLSESAILLKQCLKEDPDHIQAVWCLTGISSLLGDSSTLSELNSTLDSDDLGDPRYHLVAAVGQLEIGDGKQAQQACKRIPADSQFISESDYILGWESIARGDPAMAAEHFARAAAPNSSRTSRTQAQAVLGGIRYFQRDFDDAVEHWKGIDKQQRERWELSDPLAKTLFLSALNSFTAQDYGRAAELLREAGMHGVRDKRLGPLITLALFKAGQQILYPASPTVAENPE